MKDKILYHLIFWVLYTLLEIYLDFAWLKYQFPKISDLQRFWYAMNGELGYLVVKIPVVYLCLYFVDHPSHYFNFFIKKEESSDSFFTLLHTNSSSKFPFGFFILHSCILLCSFVEHK